MKKLALILALFAAPAFAQDDPDPRVNFAFLPEPSAAAAQSRSHQEALAMGWTGTSPGAPNGFQWWDWKAPSGIYPCTVSGYSSFLQIEATIRPDGTDFTANPGGHDGLTDAEKATLIPFSAMQAAGCFPAPAM